MLPIGGQYDFTVNVTLEWYTGLSPGMGLRGSEELSSYVYMYLQRRAKFFATHINSS